MKFTHQDKVKFQSLGHVGFTVKGTVESVDTLKGVIYYTITSFEGDTWLVGEDCLHHI